MNPDATCNTGIAAVGRIPWGSHLCNFYRTADELADCPLPFYRQCLADNEMGIWITSEPLNARDARHRLGALQPDLAQARPPDR